MYTAPKWMPHLSSHLENEKLYQKHVSKVSLHFVWGHHPSKKQTVVKALLIILICSFWIYVSRPEIIEKFNPLPKISMWNTISVLFGYILSSRKSIKPRKRTEERDTTDFPANSGVYSEHAIASKLFRFSWTQPGTPIRRTLRLPCIRPSPSCPNPTETPWPTSLCICKPSHQTPRYGLTLPFWFFSWFYSTRSGG